MNLVIVRTVGDRDRVVCRVPEYATFDVGAVVTYETKRGDYLAYCMTGTFKADPGTISRLWDIPAGNIPRVKAHMVESKLDWEEYDPQEKAFVDGDEFSE